jgi:hypothetical protein
VGFGIGGRDDPVDGCLEARPGEPAVGVRRHPLVDVGRLHGAQVPGLPCDQPGQVDPHLAGLHPPPQLRQPVTDVQAVGHQQPRRDRRHAEPGTQLGGRELGHLRRPRPAETPGLLPTGLAGLHRVQGVAVVEVGVLDGSPEDLHLTAVLGRGELGDMVEQRATRQVLDRHHIHMGIQT